MFGLGSAHSVIDYMSYYEYSYLLFTVPQFSYKFREQQVNPKKVYAIDTGIIKANTMAFTEDNGSMLENIVFFHLRRLYGRNAIFYFKDKGECDFLVKEKNRLTQAIQVCYRLTADNLEREVNGLKEAMEKRKVPYGAIITLDQEDEFEGMKAIPAWKWMST